MSPAVRIQPSELPPLAPGYEWQYSTPDGENNSTLYVGRSGMGSGGLEFGGRVSDMEMSPEGKAAQLTQIRLVNSQFRTAIDAGGNIGGIGSTLAPGTNPDILRAFNAPEKLVQHVQTSDYGKKYNIFALSNRGVVAPSKIEPQSTMQTKGQEPLVDNNTPSQTQQEASRVQEAVDTEDTAAWKANLREQMARDFQNSVKLPDGNYVRSDIWDKVPEEYKTIGLQHGLADMNEAIERDNKAVIPARLQSPVDKFRDDKGQLRLDLAVAGGYKKVDDYKGWNVSQSEIDKIDDLQQQRANAAKDLEDYRIWGNTYSLVDVLVSDEAKAIAAANKLFTEQDIKDAQKWIVENYGIGERRGGKPAETIVRFYRNITPWDEDKGETFIDAASKVKEKAFKHLPPPIAGIAAIGLPIVGVEPTPFGEIALGALVIGSAAYFALTKQQQDQVNEASKQIKTKWFRESILDDMVIVAADGSMATTAGNIRPELWQVPPLTPPKIETGMPWGKKLNIKTGTPPLTPVFIDMSSVPDLKGGVVEPVVYIPFPRTSRDAILGEAGDVMMAQAAVKTAEKVLKSSVKSVKTVDVNWNKVLSDARTAQSKADIAKAFEVINKSLKGIEARTSSRAQEDYLMKRLILERAKQSFVASLDPQPIKGTSTEASLDAYIAYSAAHMIAPSISKAASSAYTKALSKGATSAQARSAAQTATQTVAKQAIKAQNLTKGMTRAAIQTLTNTLAQTATQTATRTSTRTGTTTRTTTKTAEITKTAEKTAEGETTAIMTGKFRLKNKPTRDQELISRIEKDGALTWKQGKLNGKPQYKLWVYPYEPDDFTTVDHVPKGANLVSGPLSAYKTARVLTGKAPDKPKTKDIGAFLATVSPEGKERKKIRLSFAPDPSNRPRRPIRIVPPNRNRRPDNGMRSEKRGRIYFTPTNGGTLMSRRALGRRRR